MTSAGTQAGAVSNDLLREEPGESEATYRLLAESISQFVWIGSADGALDYCNPHALEYFGLPLAQLAHGEWLNAVFPSDLPALFDHLSAERREPFEMELRIRRSADSTWRWHLIRARPIEREGKPRWLGTGLDINDRKQAERTSALVASIVDSSADAVVGIDPDGRIASWNPAAESLFGCHSHQAIGRPASVLNPAEGEERAAERLGRALAGEHLEWRDSIRRASDGAERIVHCAIGPIRSSGKAVAAYQTFRDVTGQAKAERALSAANERLRLVQRVTRAGTWEIDVTTGLLDRSPELRALYGLKEDEFAGPEADWTRFVHPDERERVREAIASAIRNRSELRLQYRAEISGETRWLTAIGSVVEGGGAPCFIGITIDTTELQRVEEVFRENTRMESIGRLAGGVAHDFNNLLSGIVGGASLIADLLPDDHVAQSMLDLVVQSGERAAHLTQQLLAYSGKATFILRPCDISQIAQESFGLLRNTLPQNIELAVQTGWKLPAVEADAQRIREIVVNLVNNSGEAIGEREGNIWVRTGLERLDRAAIEKRSLRGDLTPGTFVYIEVRDDGPGIDGQIRPRIFEPFFSTRFTGRGLGLAAVDGIVRAHRGAIDLRSVPGEGAVFRILLPASSNRAAALTQAASAGQPRCILVIDDEEAVRCIVQAKLEHSGYRVIAAADGISGLEAFRAHRDSLSLVILDVAMPGMSGSEVLEALGSENIGVPVIVSSGYPEGEALARMGRNRAAGFLQKPFSVQELARTVEKLLHPR